MSSLIDDDHDRDNTPEFSVSELSGAVKRVVEGEFGHVRVRGEIGRVSRPRSGHVYMDLKDERAVLAGVIWKGVVAGLAVQPEEGMEVVATGRLTTFAGQSRYQIVIESLAPAGVGALMAMLEKRRKALAAEGLFDPERKRPLPFLPRAIGVVTSPSGAVIRDILHRLAERFPVRVLVWPVAVQGDKCAPEVSAGIRGFSAMQGPARPDLVIVARGGGSVEDLWGFNEESVVRAVAECTIPLISAVGHETDTTLVDHVADVRAPTPTAAAEIAVPVRGELLATVADLQARRLRALQTGLEARRQRLVDLARALPRPSQLLAERRQRLDLAAARLPRPQQVLHDRRQDLEKTAQRLAPALRDRAQQARLRLNAGAKELSPRPIRQAIAHARQRTDGLGERTAPALARIQQRGLDRLTGLGRTLGAYSYKATLARGYAVVRDSTGSVVPSADALPPDGRISIEFQNEQTIEATTTGDRPDPPAPRKKGPPKRQSKAAKDDGQGNLF